MTNDRSPRRSLEGRRALVTGGTSGIGLAVASRFVSEGADVLCVARHYRPEVDDIGARFLAADTTDADRIHEVLERTTADGGSLDVLVLNAGIASVDASSLSMTDIADVTRQLEVNTLGVLHWLTQAPAFLDDGASVIITATAATSWAFPGYMGYSLSKAPLRQIARHAAMKLGGRGIRVNTVSPGTVLTSMQPADDPEARIARVATCLGRPAFPDEVAGVYVFLAGVDSAYVTGTDIRADGGWLDGLTEAHADALLAGLDASAEPTIEAAGQTR